MNTIARASAAFLIAGATTLPAAAQELPEGGDCRFFAAQGVSYWEGRFSGSRRDLFDRLRLVSKRACFASEHACTRWINEMLSATDNLTYMRCDPK